MSWRAAGRIGVADLEPNVDLRITRGDAARGMSLGAYRRLAVVDDWGAPLGLGNSLNALLFGRDEGFYYRIAGLELAGVNGPVEWRLFGERQRNARLETHFSLPHVFTVCGSATTSLRRAPPRRASVRIPFSLGLVRRHSVSPAHCAARAQPAISSSRAGRSRSC